MHSKHSPSWFLASSKATADIGWQALGPEIGFCILALVAVMLRWYTRTCLIRKIGPEDLLVTAAMVLSIVMVGVTAGEVSIDTHVQTNELRAEALTKILKLVYVQSITFHLAINFVKASIILQYLVVFSTYKVIRYICFFLLFAILVAMAWGVFGIAFMCNPISRAWKPLLMGTCINSEHHFWSTATLGICLDFAGLVLPMPVIGKLRLPRRQKAGLVGVFGLGVFVLIVSILRLVLVHEAALHGDVTRAGVYILIWSTTEVNVAIICASLLVLKPLYARWLPCLMDDSNNNREKQDKNYSAALGNLTGSTLNSNKRDSKSHDRKDSWLRKLSTISLPWKKDTSTENNAPRVHEYLPGSPRSGQYSEEEVRIARSNYVKALKKQSRQSEDWRRAWMDMAAQEVYAHDVYAQSQEIEEAVDCLLERPEEAYRPERNLGD